MYQSSSNTPASPNKVTTVHILEDGQVIASLEEFQQVEERFSWVSKPDMIARLLRLRRITDQQKKSVIAIFEEGMVIREFINIDEHFPVAALLKEKSIDE
jgi:hypothetical protein